MGRHRVGNAHGRRRRRLVAVHINARDRVGEVGCDVLRPLDDLARELRRRLPVLSAVAAPDEVVADPAGRISPDHRVHDVGPAQDRLLEGGDRCDHRCRRRRQVGRGVRGRVDGRGVGAEIAAGVHRDHVIVVWRQGGQAGVLVERAGDGTVVDADRSLPVDPAVHLIADDIRRRRRGPDESDTRLGSRHHEAAWGRRRARLEPKLLNESVTRVTALLGVPRRLEAIEPVFRTVGSRTPAHREAGRRSGTGGDVLADHGDAAGAIACEAHVPHQAVVIRRIENRVQLHGEQAHRAAVPRDHVGRRARVHGGADGRGEVEVDDLRSRILLVDERAERDRIRSIDGVGPLRPRDAHGDRLVQVLIAVVLEFIYVVADAVDTAAARGPRGAELGRVQPRRGVGRARQVRRGDEVVVQLTYLLDTVLRDVQGDHACAITTARLLRLDEHGDDRRESYARDDDGDQQLDEAETSFAIAGSPEVPAHRYPASG